MGPNMQPLVFEPYLRPMVWGHRRLGERFGKTLPTAEAFGESWEISAHPHHVSRVAEGPLSGAALTELCASHGRELFGEQLPPDGRFPLLIKLLDCHDLLSIQVHPTDELAPKLAGETLGKTEAWVILDVEPSGVVYAGLKAGVTRDELERHVHAGTLEQCLHCFKPSPGDCVFLPAGTVHAVGGGVVMAEVQQSSDATFRLYDWNRLGTDGKPRKLHLREALESINWDAGPVKPSVGVPLRGRPGEALVRCRYFHLDRYRTAEPFAAPAGRLSIWLALGGNAELRGAGYARTLRGGETVLIPASAGELTWRPDGNATLLGVTLP
jgi:mannose-6-phosphate isomerase